MCSNMNNTIPAVDKTVQILEKLAESPCSQGELSRALGVSMSTAYRILQTLRAREWVAKDAAGRYALASGLLPLLKGFDADMEILKRARAKVEEICARFGIACKLSLRRGNEQITDCRAEPPGPVALTGQPGSTFPMVEGSVGAVLLADSPDEEIKKLLDACSAPIPEKADPRLLVRAVAEARRNGCCLNLRKNRWNIAAFSVPLRNSSGRIFGAFTLIGTVGDFAGTRRRKWEKILKNAAAECEQNQKSQ